MGRYATARERARTLIDTLDEAAFHRPAADGGWSVARCFEHLLVSGGRMAARLEAAVEQARSAGRFATPEAARRAVRPGWFARLFLAGTGPGRDGRAPSMKVATRGPFDPGDPAARGRTRGAVLADFLALQDRLDAIARRADGLDLAGIPVASVISDFLRLPLGLWFVAIAGHQERHLDQADRARGPA